MAKKRSKEVVAKQLELLNEWDETPLLMYKQYENGKDIEQMNEGFLFGAKEIDNRMFEFPPEGNARYLPTQYRRLHGLLVDYVTLDDDVRKEIREGLGEQQSPKEQTQASHVKESSGKKAKPSTPSEKISVQKHIKPPDEIRKPVLDPEVQERLELLQRWKDNPLLLYNICEKNAKDISAIDAKFYFTTDELPNEYFNKPPEKDLESVPIDYVELHHMFKDYISRKSSLRRALRTVLERKQNVTPVKSSPPKKQLTKQISPHVTTKQDVRGDKPTSNTPVVPSKTPSKAPVKKTPSKTPPAKKTPSNTQSKAPVKKTLSNTPSKKTPARKASSKRGNGEKKPMNDKARDGLKRYQTFASKNRGQIKELVQDYVYKSKKDGPKIKIPKKMKSSVCRAILSYLWKSKKSFESWQDSDEFSVTYFLQLVQEDSIQRHKDAKELLRRYGVTGNEAAERALLKLSNRKSKFSRFTPNLQDKLNEALQSHDPPLPALEFNAAPKPRVKGDMIADARELVFDELDFDGAELDRAAKIVAQNASAGCRFKRLTTKMKNALISQLKPKSKEPEKPEKPKKPTGSRKRVVHSDKPEVRNISNRKSSQEEQFEHSVKKFKRFVKGTDLTQAQKKAFVEIVDQAHQSLTTIPQTQAEINQRQITMDKISEKLIDTLQDIGLAPSSSEPRAAKRPSSRTRAAIKPAAIKPTANRPAAKKPESPSRQLAVVMDQVKNMENIEPELQGMLQLLSQLMANDIVLQQQFQEEQDKKKGKKNKKRSDA